MRLVVLRTDRLGELLLTLPVVAAARRQGRCTHLTMVVQEAYAGLIRMAPAVDDVLTVSWANRRARWRDVSPLIQQLRHGRFDAAVVMHPHRWLHWAVWRAGIPRRIGYDRKWSWCLTDRRPDRVQQDVQHEVARNQALMSALGPVTPQPGVTVRVSREAAEAMSRRLADAGMRGSPLVAVHPWASQPDKCWPLASFAALIGRLRRELGAAVVVVGGPEHDTEARQLAQDTPAAIHWAGALTLEELAACLQRCVLLISNDSGPAHVAAAVGTPTVTLFGSSHPWQGPARWRPWGDGHAVVHRVPMETIGVEDVLTAARAQCHLCPG